MLGILLYAHISLQCLVHLGTSFSDFSLVILVLKVPQSNACCVVLVVSRDFRGNSLTCGNCGGFVHNVCMQAASKAYVHVSAAKL